MGESQRGEQFCQPLSEKDYFLSLYGFHPDHYTVIDPDSRLPPKYLTVLETHAVMYAAGLQEVSFIVKLLSVYLHERDEQVPHISTGVILNVCL